MTMLFVSFLVAIISLVPHAQTSSIPDFVLQYAPLVYIDVNDPYLPSDIGAQIVNTQPELNFSLVNPVPSNLALDNLADLNTVGECSFDDFDQCSIYLTSQTNVSTDPSWLYGVLPDSATGQTVGAKSCAVVVNDHGDSTVDAFYFYFYAFNLGLNISGTILGNHVGDWEHTMLRFVDGKPDTIWYSAHDGGFTYTYDAVSKNNSRPIVYASLGGHANYPTPGLQERHYGTIILNDTTSAGPLWDPVANAYYYAFTPNTSSQFNGTFTPVADPKDSSGPLPPVDWLYFLGRWGDKQYPDSDPIQINIANITFAYEDGPTGPLDKDLNRNGTCPKEPCTTTSTLPAPTGETAVMQTITRTTAPATTSTSTSTSTASINRSSATAASNVAAGFNFDGSLEFMALICVWIGSS